MAGRRLPHQRGVSLIEALVAVAVLAFGVIGIAGMQLTLRQNSDAAKQRSEAVRIAQAAIEQARDYVVVASDGTNPAFDDIGSVGATVVTGISSNTDYTLTITSPALATGAPRLKRYVAGVTWTDRSGAVQGPLSLTTMIAGVPPQLAGSAGVPITSAPTQLPGGRNVGIPSAAVDQNDGTSQFTPPGGGGVTWTFDNTTGVITNVCDSSGTCTAGSFLLLGGFVQFATTVTSPSGPQPSDAEAPPGPAISPPAPAAAAIGAVTGVHVDLTSPASTTVNCFVQTSSTYITYYCAVPTTGSTPAWSGTSTLDLATGAIAGTSGPSSRSANRIRICRYTPVNSDTPTDSSGQLVNAWHPLNYAGVTTALLNQNFLVIRAGNGTTSYACPADDTSTPYINGNTKQHQP